MNCRIIVRQFHANASRKASQSSKVVTDETKLHLLQKKNLKPKITLLEAVKQWINLIYRPLHNLQLKQDALLNKTLPGYYKSQVGDLKASNNKVSIDGKGNYLNEIRIENGDLGNVEDAETTKNLVMIHGYASASGLFYKNFDNLICNQKDARIFALDLPGFGLSSKSHLDCSRYLPGTKEFPIKFDKSHLDHAKHVHKSLKLPSSFEISTKDLLNYNIDNQLKLITKVEDYYIDSLELWRIENKLENFTLFGHSLGGYLSILYALKYPTRVSKLVIVSPGGVERGPFAITNPILKNIDPNEQRIIAKPSISCESYDFLGRYPIMSEFFRKLWIWQISPFHFLRLAGPYSYKLVYTDLFKKLSRNLSNFDSTEDLKLVIDYLYNSIMLKSNLEHLIMKIFASNVTGKYPMFDRIQNLKTQKNLWLFGEFDFMYNSIGSLSSAKMQSHGINSDFKIISKSGHNLYFDNWDEFNKELKKFLNWK